MNDWVRRTLIDIRASADALRTDLNTPQSGAYTEEYFELRLRNAHRVISQIWKWMRRIEPLPVPSKPQWARRPHTIPGEFFYVILGEPFDGSVGYKPPDAEEVHETLDAVDKWCDAVQDVPARKIRSSQSVKAIRDRGLEARDKWIYAECCKGTAYDRIAILLKNKPKSWPRIESKQGIMNAAKRYAERNELPPIPKRQE